MKTLTRTPALAALCALLPLAAVAQEPEKEGPKLTGSVQEIQIGGRVQTQFNTTTAEGVPGTELFLRRARLEVEVKVNDLVSGAIQPEIAGDRLQLKDVYLKLGFSPALQLLAGKAHRPFSLLEQTSSKRILPVERGAALRGLDPQDEYEIVHDLGYSDRDVGLQVMGAPKWAPLGFAYQAGVFRGPLHQRAGTEDSYQYAARATVRPVERLRLGAAWSARDFASDSLVDGTPLRVEKGHAWEVDAEYGAFAPGLHFLGEVVFGDYDPFADADFTGAQAWLGYRTRALSRGVTGVEPLLRASWGDVDDGGPVQDGTLLTPGINVYFGPLNRIMLNYDFWSPRRGDAEGSFKAQFQLGF